MEEDTIRLADDQAQPRRDHTSIEIGHQDSTLVSSIKQKMEDITTSSSISKIPQNLLQGLAAGDPNPYTPQKIAIGPLHRHNPTLKPSEPLKWRYLHSHLSRTPETLETSLRSLVTSLRLSEHRARLCYAPPPDDMSSDEFVQMLLLDGCFLAELLMKYSFKRLRRRGDPIFSREGMLFELRSDLVMLENQIPFFVVETVFAAGPRAEGCGGATVAEMAFRVFRNMLQGHGKEVLAGKFGREGNHLLDLVYHSFLPTNVREIPKEDGGGSALNGLDCVTRLLQRGMKVKKAKTAECLLDIKLSNGVLEIPPLKIHRYTESLLSNAIAYEQCYKESTHYVTSYALLMHTLIASDIDSKLLFKLNIILSSSDDTKDKLNDRARVCGMFRRLAEGTVVKGFYYEALCERANGFLRKGLGGGLRRRGRRRRRPQANVVLVVAVVVLVLTFVGTSFTILSFFTRS